MQNKGQWILPFGKEKTTTYIVIHVCWMLMVTMDEAQTLDNLFHWQWQWCVQQATFMSKAFLLADKNTLPMEITMWKNSVS